MPYYVYSRFYGALRYDQLSSAETILQWGYPGLLLDKIRQHRHLHLTKTAVKMIANQIVDPLSFSLIFSSYIHLFSVDSLISAVSGGNIVALDMIHKHLIKRGIAFPLWSAIAEAFMCGHVHILKYIIENVDLTVHYNDTGTHIGFYCMGQGNALIKYNRLKRRHLEGYLYLRDKLTSNQFTTVFGRDLYHVVYMEDIALFDETFSKMDRKDIQEITTLITNITKTRTLLWLDRNKKKAESKRRVDVGYLDFVEHVLKACIVNGDSKELATLSETRNRARSLTSDLTPEKEVLLTLLEIAKAMSIAIDKSSYISMIEWNDLDLTPYLLKMFGFDLICCHGTLAQVEAAHQLLGPDDNVTDKIWSSENVDVLRFIHANRTEPCPRSRLVGEYNLEIVKFLVESCPPRSLNYSLNYIMYSNNVGIIKYLLSHQDRWVNQDTEVDGHSIQVSTLEMMQYLVDTNHDNDKIDINTQEYDIATIQLFINKVGAESVYFIDLWPRLMDTACRQGIVGHVEYLLSVAPTPTSTYYQGYSPLDKALTFGHMNIIHMLLASNRGEIFYKSISWTNAGILGDIDLFEMILANSIKLENQINFSLVAANKHGRIALVKHITTNYTAQFEDHDLNLLECIQNDHADGTFKTAIKATTTISKDVSYSVNSSFEFDSSKSGLVPASTAAKPSATSTPSPTQQVDNSRFTVPTKANLKLECPDQEKLCFETDHLDILGTLTMTHSLLSVTSDILLGNGSVGSLNNARLNAPRTSVTGLLTAIRTTFTGEIIIRDTGKMTVNDTVRSTTVSVNKGEINIIPNSSLISNTSSSITNQSKFDNFGDFLVQDTLSIQESTLYSEGKVKAQTIDNSNGIIEFKNGNFVSNKFVTASSRNSFVGTLMSLTNILLKPLASMSLTGGSLRSDDPTGEYHIQGTLNLTSSNSSISNSNFTMTDKSIINLNSGNMDITSKNFESSGTSNLSGTNTNLKFSGDSYSMIDGSSMNLLSSILNLNSPILSISGKSQMNFGDASSVDSTSETSLDGDSSMRVGRQSTFKQSSNGISLKDNSAVSVTDGSSMETLNGVSLLGLATLSLGSNSRLNLLGSSKMSAGGQSIVTVTKSHLESGPETNIHIGSKFQVDDGGIVNIGGLLVLQAGGSIRSTGGSRMSLGGAEGNIDGDASFSGNSGLDVTNSTILSVSGRLNITDGDFNMKGGRFTLQQNGSLLLSTGKLVNDASFTTMGSVGMESDSHFTNSPTGLVKIFGVFAGQSGSVSNDGKWSFMDGTKTFVNDFTNNGELDLQSASLESGKFACNGNLLMTKSIIKMANGSLALNQGGSLSGEGTIDGNITHQHGMIGSMNNTSNLNITGSLVQSPNATTTIFIGGNVTEGTDYSIINVGNDATVDGNLVIRIDDSKLKDIASGNQFISFIKSGGELTGDYQRVKITVFNPKDQREADLDGDCHQVVRKKGSMALLIQPACSSVTYPESKVFSNNTTKMILIGSVVGGAVALSVASAVLIYKRHSISNFLKIKRESILTGTANGKESEDEADSKEKEEVKEKEKEEEKKDEEEEEEEKEKEDEDEEANNKKQSNIYHSASESESEKPASKSNNNDKLSPNHKNNGSSSNGKDKDKSAAAGGEEEEEDDKMQSIEDKEEEIDQTAIEEELQRKSKDKNNVHSTTNNTDDDADDGEYEDDVLEREKRGDGMIGKSTYSSNKEADIEIKRRMDCLGKMERIEKEFSDLKEKFFNDKLGSIKKEMEEIKIGEHQVFQEKIRELDLKKEKKMQMAEAWKNYQLQNILNMFDAERQQFEDEYDQSKSQKKLPLCLFVHTAYSAELCGPRSCHDGMYCISDYTTALCRPVEQSKLLVEFNVTADGIWTNSAQFKGSLLNMCGKQIRRITFHAEGFELLKSTSIWNARYDEEFNELYIPDFQDGIPNDAIYTFGFISGKVDKPPLKIKSIRF
eukprot:gene10265-11972_t